jgi:quercetin dioxygenase-like cupin family protein
MHQRRFPSIRRAVIVLLVAFGAGIATTQGASAASGPTQPVTRIILGRIEPANAPGQSLTLQRVVIAPGAKLAEHFHEGTQLATIRAGVLTYHVVSGTVTVTRADGAARTVTGPSSVKLRKGDTIVETESLVHYGANDTSRKVVIDLTALLHVDAELSTPVGASATDVSTTRLETTLSSMNRVLYQAGPNNRATYGTNRLVGSSTVDGQPVEIEMLATVDYTSGSGPFSGVVTFTFADGSSIGVTMQGASRAAPNGTDASFASTLGVIGGTGRYVDAAGYGTFTGTRSAALGADVSALFVLQLRK